MGLPWIRLYTEMLNDPKLKRLTAAEKWIWVGLLLMGGASCERGTLLICEGVPYTTQDLMSQLDLDINETDILEPALNKFQQLRMIETDPDGTIYILNFDKRQYDKPSNRPEAVNERVKRHRNKSCNANVTPLKRQCNNPDTDTDLDTDIDKDKEFKTTTAAVNLFKTFEQEFGRMLSPMEIQEIRAMETESGPELTKEALRRAVANRVLKTSYIQGILNKWSNENLTTLAAVLDYEQAEKKVKPRKQQGQAVPLQQPTGEDKFAMLNWGNFGEGGN